MPGIGNAIGIPFKKGGGISWSSYWSQQSEVLFFGLYSEISGGQMPNKVTGATDYLTVAGSAGSETYQCPNTAAYIAADTDYIWFTVGSVQRIVTTAELKGYDLQRTPVKYNDATPNAIVAIMILNMSVIGTKRDRMFTDFWLPVMWDNSFNIYGHVKDNRGATQQLWIAVAYKAVYDAFVIKPSAADIVIQQNMMDDLVLGGYYAKAEFMYVFALHNEAASLFDWKNPTGSFNPVKVNTPTWTQYRGFNGVAASTSYIRTNFNPKINCNSASVNSLTVMWACQNNVAESKQDFGCGETTNNIWGISRNAATTMISVVNDNYLGGVNYNSVNANSNKHFAISRVNGTQHLQYKNKIKSTLARTSTDLPNAEFYILCVNGGGPTNINSRIVSYLFMFSGLTDAEIEAVTDIMETYLDSYGFGLI